MLAQAQTGRHTTSLVLGFCFSISWGVFFFFLWGRQAVKLKKTRHKSHKERKQTKRHETKQKGAVIGQSKATKQPFSLVVHGQIKETHTHYISSWREALSSWMRLIKSVFSRHPLQLSPNSSERIFFSTFTRCLDKSILSRSIGSSVFSNKGARLCVLVSEWRASLRTDGAYCFCPSPS